jgi:hypothetical protein
MIRLVAPPGTIIGMPAPRGMKGSWVVVGEQTTIFDAEPYDDGTRVKLHWKVPPLTEGPPLWKFSMEDFRAFAQHFVDVFGHRLIEK